MCVCGQTWSSWWAKWKAKEMTDEMRITYLTTDDRDAHYYNRLHNFPHMKNQCFSLQEISLSSSFPRKESNVFEEMEW